MAPTGIEATERRNPKSKEIHKMTSLQIVRLINKEDRKVPLAVSEEATRIARIVDAVTNGLKSGGRVFYVGAGTSGRLGVLDAAEMPPTFGLSATKFQGIVAGGWSALRKSIEGAEDDEEAARKELDRRGICSKDILIGLSASGRTPFVLAAMRAAQRIGAKRFGITCNPKSEMACLADETIILRVGPEIIAGSSRMKCGTAQKMVLNMISTASMVRLGRAWEGLMVNLEARSRKLQKRAMRIVSEVARVDHLSAKKALDDANGNVRLAIVMLRRGVSVRKARKILANTEADIEKIVSSSQRARKKAPDSQWK